MGPIPPADLQARVLASPLHKEYATAVDRESAREVLAARAKGGAESGSASGGAAASAPPRRAAGNTPAEEPDVARQIGQALGSPLAKAVGRELVRGLFGVLGVSSSTRRRRLW
jgi:hypothetical protein